jgi:2'-5' RNA ligase
MSLFVAVRPGVEAVEHLDDYLQRVRRDPRLAAIRWQPPQQWHVTLSFLGDPEEDTAFEVAERLDALADRAAIPGVRLIDAGCFGKQILWMGVHTPDPLPALVAAIPELLRGSGAIVDRRTWRAHLTIGRARHGDARAGMDALNCYVGPDWTVEDLLLIRSTGGPHPDHRVVHRIELAGAPSP